MIYSVKISAQAEEDLKSILKLKEMSERFMAYDKESWKARGLRIMPVYNYLVFYIPDKETQTVIVIRVMYGGRDTQKQLNQ